MRLIIEVRSAKVNCGLPLEPESDDTTGRSHHSFTIVHQLAGNNDAFYPQMYEALVRFRDEGTRVFNTMNEQYEPIVRLTVDDLQQMYLTAMAVQMEYEHLVRVVASQLETAPAAS